MGGVLFNKFKHFVIVFVSVILSFYKTAVSC